MSNTDSNTVTPLGTPFLRTTHLEGAASLCIVSGHCPTNLIVVTENEHIQCMCKVSHVGSNVNASRLIR